MGKQKEKGKIYEQLHIDSMTTDGKCVARHQDRVVFVQQVAPGDVVDVRVIRQKRRHLEAVPVQFHTYSPERETPFCTHFNTCGGCKWQHVNYAQQLKFKHQEVSEQLRRLAKVELPEIPPVLPSAQVQYYRNKLEFTFADSRWLTLEEVQSGESFDRNALGFHVPGRFDKIVQVDHCYLQPDPSNAIRQALYIYSRQHQLPYYNFREHTGLMRNLIIRTASTGQTMAIVQFAQPEMEAIEGVMAHLKAEFPDLASLQYIINTKKNETIYDQEVVCYHGLPYIEEEMEGLRFRIGPKSFYQTNSAQAYELYKVAREFAALEGHERVYDLYTGTGTIANFVARQAGEVVGIEYVPEAIEDAKENAQLNGIENTRFFAGDMKDLLTPGFVAEQGQPDVVITDPPRAGMHEDVVRQLLQVAPGRIVYVSCNVATQARDLALLDEKYQVERVQPVDMFPHTSHIENVVLLQKR